MKVHLVDGTYELFRAYYGAPGKKTSGGKEVGAVVGFCRSMMLLLRQPEVSHLACAFDHVIESFRNQLFPGYKTGAGIEKDLLEQFPLVEEATRLLGVVVWPMVQYEADDALASAAAKWVGQAEIEQVILCSPDKDLAQCVSGERIVCEDRRRKKILNEEGVWAKFGVAPGSIPDYLALVGDSADGIPGLPGWGTESAARVLAHYKHLEQIPADDREWKVRASRSAALAQTLQERWAEVLLYRNLACLRIDVPLEEDLDDLRWGGIEEAKLAELCGLLETPRLWSDARPLLQPS